MAQRAEAGSQPAQQADEAMVPAEAPVSASEVPDQEMAVPAARAAAAAAPSSAGPSSPSRPKREAEVPIDGVPETDEAKGKYPSTGALRRAPARHAAVSAASVAGPTEGPAEMQADDRPKREAEAAAQVPPKRPGGAPRGAGKAPGAPPEKGRKEAIEAGARGHFKHEVLLKSECSKHEWNEFHDNDRGVLRQFAAPPGERCERRKRRVFELQEQEEDGPKHGASQRARTGQAKRVAAAAAPKAGEGAQPRQPAQGVRPQRVDGVNPAE